MIAQRFRAVGWVAVVASAATGLYLISLQVAVERGKLEAVEAQIVLAQREVRQLQTEMGTRASMRQLERWNGDVLALSAPKATQFVHDGAQLVTLDLDSGRAAPNAPPPVMASIVVSRPVEATVPPVADKPFPKIVTALFVKPQVGSPVQRVAMIEPVTVRDVTRIAQLESRERP